MTLGKSLSLFGPLFPQMLNKAERDEKMSGLFEGPQSGMLPGYAGQKQGVRQLTDILVKTDSSRDRTDRYMRIRWPP